MRHNIFSQLLQVLKKLTPLQKEKVEDLLHHECAIDTLRAAIKDSETVHTALLLIIKNTESFPGTFHD